MADFLAHFGAVIDVNATPRNLRFVDRVLGADQERGILINKGPNEVYVGWNKDVAHADTSEEDDKAWLVVNDWIPIARSVSLASLVTASGSAKVVYISS